MMPCQTVKPGIYDFARNFAEKNGFHKSKIIRNFNFYSRKWKNNLNDLFYENVNAHNDMAKEHIVLYCPYHTADVIFPGKHKKDYSFVRYITLTPEALPEYFSKYKGIRNPYLASLLHQAENSLSGFAILYTNNIRTNFKQLSDYLSLMLEYNRYCHIKNKK